MRMLTAIFLSARRLIMEKQGKKLSELRVVDLRRILEKRGLDKTGNKSVLVDRLSKCLTDEGHDANIYVHSVDVEEDMANDSQLSDVGQLEDSLRESESKETISDAMADDTELIDEDNEADQPCGEELSFQEPDKMVEVDSLHHERTEFSNLLQEESVDGAESTTTARKGSTCVDNGVVGVDADTTQGTEERTSADVTDKGIENEFSDLNRLADTVLEVTSTKTEQTLAEADGSSGADTDGTFVVHIDESDTNLDYDLPGDKGEERDAPTPTKDESMDVDSADIVQSTENAFSGKEAGKTEEATRGSDQAGSKSSTDNRNDTAKKESKDLSASQNLWISGLSSLTRATDLKGVFTKHGKVIGAKVVTNANRPGAKCYGYVTMSSSEEAAKCIQHLHRTELHGRMISVEKAKTDPAAQARAASQRKPANVEEKKKDESTANKEPAAGPDDGRPGQVSHRADDKGRHPERHRPRVPVSAGATKKEGEPVKEGEKKPEKKELTEAERKAEEYVEREKRRLRLLERRARDDDYRRRNTLLKEKREISEQMRHMRMEEERLNREREKLRLEREKARIEEIKLESLQGERTRLENQLMELRQRVDREREELKRVETLRLEEMRRSASLKRSYEASTAARSTGGSRYDDGWEAKRPATSDRYSAVSVDRRGTTASSDRYSERRAAPELDRRAVASKEVGVERSNGRSDDRYNSRSSGGERREYTQGEGRSRDVSSRSVAESRGAPRSYHDSSRRSGDRSDRATWNGSAGGSGLLSGPSNELFSGAAVQAAGMMMSAAMNRGGSSSSSSRYSAGAPSSGGYPATRRY